MFKTKANPTFIATVKVPVAGAEPEALLMVFKHKTRTEVKDYLERIVATTTDDVGPLLEIIDGWRDVDAEFSHAALSELVQNYHGAVTAILDAYLRELAEGRRGN